MNVTFQSRATNDLDSGCLVARFRAMGGPCEIRAWTTDETLQLAAREVYRLERKYSRYLEDSETSRINSSAGCGRIRTDRETALLLDYADKAWRVSEGMFDITSGVLRRAWNFREQRLPSRSELALLMQYVGWEKLRFRGDALELRDGMEIDFGGIVKEYAADRVVALLRAKGVCHALVELAGDIAVTGPMPDDVPWLIRVRHPRLPGCTAGEIELASGGVATSGDYERCINIEGKRYGHILDARTGWPVEGVASVTVRHEACVVAGTLATIGMLKGREARSWLASQDVEAICIDA